MNREISSLFGIVNNNNDLMFTKKKRRESKQDIYNTYRRKVTVYVGSNYTSFVYRINVYIVYSELFCTYSI